jgi:hypothetical protein
MQDQIDEAVRRRRCRGRHRPLGDRGYSGVTDLIFFDDPRPAEGEKNRAWIASDRLGQGLSSEVLLTFDESLVASARHLGVPEQMLQGGHPTL